MSNPAAVVRSGIWSLIHPVVWLVALCGPAAMAAEPYPPPAFLPPAGHPRVYFTAADLPRLRENVQKPQNRLAWAEHMRQVGTELDGVLPPSTQPSGENMDSRVLSVISSYAFEYALHGDESLGRRAIAALRNYLTTVRYPAKDYNNTGQTVHTAGLVYDWCYPLLTPEDRAVLTTAMLETAARMEIGWPPVQQGNVTGHGPEGQLFRDLLVAAIAVHDEKPEMYQLVAGRLLGRMVEPKKFMYPAHMHHQGMHYCNYRGQWEMLATWIFDRMGLPRLFGAEQQYLMYWTLYARRGDGQVLRDGDTHINNRPPGEYWTAPYRTMFLAANYFKDPYLKMEAARQRPDFAPMTPRGNQALDCVELLIFNDPDLAPRPLDELPLSHYFPSPKGAMIARTGWEDGPRAASVVAEMEINEWYFANHQHLDAGAFQIYYRGVLANDSGYYQAGNTSSDNSTNNGASGYGSLHDLNYNKRSIAHNVMTVYDPAERFDTQRWAHLKLANDGGQRMPNLWREPREQEEFLDPANGYRIAAVLGRGFGPDPQRPDYTYIKGDLARAYSSKVRAYERSFAFLNLKDAEHPAVVVVFDRVVSSDAGFRKAWLLHGLEEPERQGNRTIFRDRRSGYTGKLTVDTLLPAPDDTQITAVGGQGREAWVEGVNYRADVRPGGVNEGHGWRIEVSPRTAREQDYFLHVLQVGDHTPETPPLPVIRVETDTHLGVQVGDRVVLFGKSRDRDARAVELTLQGATRVLVADLTSGTWRIERDGQAEGTVEVAPDSGTAYFTAGAGKYRLSPAGG